MSFIENFPGFITFYGKKLIRIIDSENKNNKANVLFFDYTDGDL